MKKSSNAFSIAILSIAILSLSATMMSCSGRSGVSNATADQKRGFANIQAPVREGTACKSHLECPAGSACLQDVCVAMDQVACHENTDCPEYQQCILGTCAECGNEIGCSDGFICNANGICVPEKPEYIHCNKASDCSNGQACVNGLCKDFCTSSAECSHRVCASANNLSVGLCIDDRACNSSYLAELQFTCNNNGLCLKGECYRFICTSDDQCKNNQICNQGSCQDIECNSDDDCMETDKCIDFVCKCTSNAQCGHGKVCQNSKCIDYKSPECVDSAQCGEGKFCSYAQKCKEIATRCQSDEDCPLNERCNKHGFCFDDEIASGKLIIEETCENDEQCSGRGGTKCNPVKRRAWNIASYKFEVARSCDFLCTTNADCESNENCILGVCRIDENRHFCNTNDDCAAGYLCNTLYHECTYDRNSGEPTIIDTLNSLNFIDKMRFMSKLNSSPLSKTYRSCYFDSDCEGNQICLYNGKCGCINNDQCNNGFQCSTNAVCECSVDDNNCPQGFVCEYKSFEGNVCKCTVDEVCGDGKLCSEDGLCVADTNSDELYAHGLDYQFGFNHPIDLKAAENYYEKAIKYGDIPSQFTLGLMYYNQGDTAKGEEYITNALKRHDENVLRYSPKTKLENQLMEMDPSQKVIQSFKGFLMMHGIVLPKDVDQGIEILKEMSENHSGIATYYLLDYYLNSENLYDHPNAGNNLAEARKLFETTNTFASIRLNAYAFTQIAYLAANNLEQLMAIDEEPVEINVSDEDCEDCYQKRNSLPSIRDYIRPLKYASDKGFPEAEYQAALLEALDDWDISFSLSPTHILEHAAASGHEKAKEYLQKITQNDELIYGLLIKGSEESLEKAYELGSIKACKKLVENHRNNRCAEELRDAGLIAGSYLLYKAAAYAKEMKKKIKNYESNATHREADEKKIQEELERLRGIKR